MSAAVVPVDAPRPRSVYWDYSSHSLKMINQIDLPADPIHGQTLIEDHVTIEHVWKSIKTMLVRGAPAIGAAGAFGMVIAANKSTATNAGELVTALREAKAYLDSSRPTAVNLSWATARILELAEMMHKHDVPVDSFRSRLLHEAQELADDDVRINRRLGGFGAEIAAKIQTKQQGTINFIHHCNTGCLATVDFGTALGVIYSAFEKSQADPNAPKVHVWVDETRPRLQGARLTAWELARAGVNFHVQADGASGLLMYQNKVDMVVFGADRVALNGDTANKIGTCNLACVAQSFQVPVYACVPTSTIDLLTKSGEEIEIEERGSEEVTHVGAEQITPLHTKVFNPAFDVTPHRFLTGIITEEGIAYPPFHVSLREHKEKAEARIRADWDKRLQTYLKK